MDKQKVDDATNVNIIITPEMTKKLVEAFKDFANSLKNIEYSIANIERKLSLG